MPDDALTANGLSEAVVRHRLTVLSLPSSLWHRWVAWLLDSDAVVRWPLRLVIVGSVPIYTSRLREWRSLRGSGNVEWIAVYGLTETEVTTLPCRPAAHRPLPATATVPIGTPIRGAEAWVLDERGQPLPAGVAGNLYFGGICLARCYLNEPELTARKFSPLPEGRPTAARLYETGEVALRQEDGTLIWLGRSDNQIKLRGFRIEPAEIEQALCQHPAVREAAVVIRPDLAEDPHLVAFVVPRTPGSPFPSC